MNQYRNFTFFAVVLALSLAMPLVGQAAPPAPPNMIPIEQAQNRTQIDKVSTPQLIEAAVASGELDRETANLYLAYALVDHTKLPTCYHSNVPWSGTLPMLKLQRAVETMKVSAARATIEKLLTGACSDSSGAMSDTSNSAHFHIEYNSVGGGLSIGDYSTSLETTWSQEITSFGWAAPPVLTGNPPPGNRYHVRIDNLGGGLYGYVANNGEHAGYVGNNPNTTWDDTDAYATCMVLNDDYSGFPGSAQRALDATTAHEFNHSIQFGYGAITGANSPDDSFVEGGATWMEDEAFDSADDNYNYLWPDFGMCMGEYENTSSPNPYPYWITFRGLTERYGTGAASGGEDVMQDFWEETSASSTSNMFSAMNTALVNKGTTLADAYHAYAIAVKFNKTCTGGYIYPYCFEEGANYVSAAGATSVHGAIATAGGNYSGSIADNYALNWITLPGAGVYTVTLINNSSGGQLRGSIVCDTGSALDVTPLPSVADPGGSSALANVDPSGCSSIVAIVTNQSQTADNPTSCTDHGYQLSTMNLSTAPTAITAVSISGSTSGITGTTYTFDASVSPTSADTPITYTWQATDNTSQEHTGQGSSDSASFSWSTAGTKTIQVTAYNGAGSPVQSSQHTINITSPSDQQYIYLPLAVRVFPEPTCNPIGESNNINDALTVSSGQTVCGQVDDTTDLDDVYKVLLLDDQMLTLSMTGDGGNADLYLYGPSATDVNTDLEAAYSANTGNTEFLQGAVTPGGYWYIDVYAYSGATDYELTITVSTFRGREAKPFIVTGTTENTLRRNQKQHE